MAIMDWKKLLRAAACGTLACGFVATAGAQAAFNFDDQVILRDDDTNGDDSNQYVRVAVDGDVAIAVWQTLNSALTWDVFYSRTTDGGDTWSADVKLTNQAISAGKDDIDPRAIFDDGELMITWSNGDANSGDIYYAHSTNFTTAPDTGSISFTSGVVYEGVGTEEVGAMAAADASGNWVIVYEGENASPADPDDTYDIYAVRSTDDGATWSAPVLVNNDANDNGEDGDCRVTYGGGSFVAIWKSESDMGGTVGTDEDIFVSASANGLSWSAAPIAITPWAATDDDDDDNPMITFANNKFVACWQSGFDDGNVGDDADIVLAVADAVDLMDWTVVFAPDAATDTADDEDPWIAGSGNGSVMCVWSSEEDGDFDIEAAFSTDLSNWIASGGPINSGGVGEDDDDEKPGIAGGDRATFFASWPPDEKDAAVARTINAAADLSITGQATVAVGGELALTANIGGFLAPVTTQWVKDDTDLTGETGLQFLVPGATVGDAGNYQFRVEDASKGIFVSPVFTVSVVPQLPVSGLVLIPVFAMAGAAVLVRRRK